MRTAIACIAIVGTLFTLSLKIANAQPGLIEINPQQGSDGRFHPPPQSSGQGESPPSILGQGSLKEIPLPKVFRGCWYGSVARLDSVRPIMPDAARLIWLTKNYAICYQQLGYNGKWQLTFADGSVAERSRVSDERQSVKVLSADGANRAVLSGYLHFKARVIDSVNQTISIRTLDETSLLRCNVFPERSNVFPERNLMSVSAEVLIETDGSPFANITWHTFLSRGG